MNGAGMNRMLPDARKLLGANRVSTKRSLMLMTFGAAAGLVLAGYSLFTAHSTTTLFVPADDVALVNQQPITRADYYAQIQTDYSLDFPATTKEQRQKVLNDMIREELFVQRGKELDVGETDPDVRAATVNAVEQMAAADVMTEKPDQRKLRAYYDAHRDRYAEEGLMTVADLVFASANDAGEAMDAIRGGAPVTSALTRFHGRDSGKEHGEDFYFAARIHLGDALFGVARALPAGGIGGPVKLADGFHLLAMAKNTPPKLRDFETALPQLLNDYRNDEIKRVTQAYNAFLKKRANILIAGDFK
jgi:parvulin-like peptidyl-prolyl isomerase